MEFTIPKYNWQPSYLQRKAIEACYYIQPNELAELIERDAFDKTLLDDIGGILCPIPIY